MNLQLALPCPCERAFFANLTFSVPQDAIIYIKISNQEYHILTFSSSSGERVNLSTFSPACLPRESNSLEGRVGHILGGFLRKTNLGETFCLGWGLIEHHNAARLQVVQVIILWRRKYFLSIEVCIVHLDSCGTQNYWLHTSVCCEKSSF